MSLFHRTLDVLIITVAQVSFDIGTRCVVAFLLLFLEGAVHVTELASAFFFFYVIVAGSVFEDSVLVVSEKIKKSHNLTNVIIFLYICFCWAHAQTSVKQERRLLLNIARIMDIRVGQGFDVHALAADLPMWLCGVKIDSECGFVAHSDGDVAIHALCDALLGALALGDIGHLFPDSSDEFKGIDSKILLRRVMDIVGQEGWRVSNADITIALQAPKIAPYISAMRESLASVMGTDVSRVSVKATTTERLGFVGRKEGCEVWATVLLLK